MNDVVKSKIQEFLAKMKNLSCFNIFYINLNLFNLLKSKIAAHLSKIKRNEKSKIKQLEAILRRHKNFAI